MEIEQTLFGGNKVDVSVAVAAAAVAASLL